MREDHFLIARIDDDTRAWTKDASSGFLCAELCEGLDKGWICARHQIISIIIAAMFYCLKNVQRNQCLQLTVGAFKSTTDIFITNFVAIICKVKELFHTDMYTWNLNFEILLYIET